MIIRKGKFCPACQKDEENDMSSHCCGREYDRLWKNGFQEMKYRSPAINIEEVKQRRFGDIIDKDDPKFIGSNSIKSENKYWIGLGYRPLRFTNIMGKDDKKLSKFQLIKRFIFNLFGWNE